MLNRSIEQLGKYFLCTLILVSAQTASANIDPSDEGLVIIEKPTEESVYKPDDWHANAGEPVVKQWAKYWAVSYMKKEFTNVTVATDNIPSSFMGVVYGFEYNWRHLSIATDLGIFVGGKDSALADEASNSLLVSALANQIVGDLGANLLLNSFSHWYFRPYVGGGVYANRYTYLDPDELTEKKSFVINSSFVRAGLLLNIGALDSESGKNLWQEFGIFRTQLQLEAKKYTPIDETNLAKFELTASLVFEY